MKNVMGLVFANIYDSTLGQLTNKRTQASLPYGGRYRQIDFTLSNMSNAGIRHIGIITQYNYQSLMNHIGSGEEWDLELEENGLEFITPFSSGHAGSFRGKLEAIDSAMTHLEFSHEEYVILADAAVLCAIDLEAVVKAHVESGKDVYELLDLGFGKCHVMMAVPRKEKRERLTDYAQTRVATKFPHIAEQFFTRHGMQMEYIKLNGSIELGPIVGLSESIVDIVETGTTLKENDLEEIAYIMDATARLIANRVSFKLKFERIHTLVEELKKVMAAGEAGK